MSHKSSTPISETAQILRHFRIVKGSSLPLSLFSHIKKVSLLAIEKALILPLIFHFL